MPSPNITLNNFGYLSDLIIARAATESVAHIVAEKSINSVILKLMIVSLSEYLLIQSKLFIAVNKPKTMPKLIRVPNIPYRLMYEKF